MLDSMLTAWSLEPVSDSVSPSLSLLLPYSHSVCLSLSKINKHEKNWQFDTLSHAITQLHLRMSICDICLDDGGQSNGVYNLKC